MGQKPCFYTRIISHEKGHSEHIKGIIAEKVSYSQIEKEGLDTIYDLKDFHRFYHSKLSLLGNVPLKSNNDIRRQKRNHDTYGKLLNYDYRIEYLASKALGYNDGLDRLIPSNNEHLEGTVIVAQEMIWETMKSGV